MPRDSETVRAAGGVVVRDGRMLLVHRPRYGDWTFPKGKLEPGETDEQAALREVEEETALQARLVRELPSTRYTTRGGRPKLVRWWLMEADGEARAENEVDEVRWVGPAEARELLTYGRDHALVDAL